MKVRTVVDTLGSKALPSSPYQVFSSTSTNMYLKNQSTLSQQGKIRLHIIIADDESFIRKASLRQLDRYFQSLKVGIEVVFIEVTDGIECLFAVYNAILLNINIDLIITDETMKYMSGSFFAEILSKVHGMKIPVVIVTAYEGSSEEKYSSKSIRGVFSKPLNNKLLEQIFKVADLSL